MLTLLLFFAIGFGSPPMPATAADGASVRATTKKNSLGMEFQPIPAGEFLMGSAADDPEADDDERPRHAVRISRPYYLGRFEVTQGEYLAVMGENPSWFSQGGGGRGDVGLADTSRLPVEFISWEEANEFCRRLSALPAERAAGRSYRLPTEAEWEYAARAGTTTRFYTGDALLPKDADIRSDAAPHITRPVGSYAPNAWGLYDMHGNVWEWCSDRYDSETYRPLAARTGDGIVVDPQGPAAGTGRVVRGGDYRFDARQARSANRDFTRHSRRDWGNGLRVVLVARGGEK